MKLIQHLLFITCFILVPLLSKATTITWIGGTGLWENTSNWSTGNLPTYDDSVIITSGIVTVDNYATARNIHIQGGELKVFGNLILQVDQALPGGYLNAIKINDGTVFYNNGLVVLLEYAYVAGVGHLIYNNGEIENDSKGVIHLNGPSYVGIHNNTGANLINRGQLVMENVDTGIYSKSPCSNYGSISIESTGTSLYCRESFYNSSTASIETNNKILFNSTGNMNNYGDIIVESDVNWNIGIQVDGIWNSRNNSSINISGEFNFGLYCTPNSEFRNRGQINIESERLFTNAVYMNGFFVNHQSGSITTKASNGVYVDGAGLNYGIWRMIRPDIGTFRSIGLYSNGSFNNRPKGKLYMDDIINSASGTTFNNQGHMFLTSTETQNSIDGTFNNTACLNDLYGNLPSSINNTSIIVESLNESPEVNIPIPNALNLGNNLGASVLTWYTTATGSTVAGSYNSNTNTFIPNANAIGLSSLYVRTRINAGGVTRRHEIQFDDPIQALTSIQNNKLMNTKTFKTSIITYPNPATDYIRVSTQAQEIEIGTIKLYDLKGQEVTSRKCDDLTNCEIDLPINIGNGLYHLSIFDKRGQYFKTETVKVFR